MPNRDGTGPMGKGPRTGRGLGKCKQFKLLKERSSSIWSKLTKEEKDYKEISKID